MLARAACDRQHIGSRLLTLAYAWELPLIIAMILVFCTVVISTPVENTLLARYTPGRWRATAFGAKFVVSLGLGSLGLPLVALVYESTADFFWLFVILSGLALTIAVIGLLLPPDRPRAVGPVERLGLAGGPIAPHPSFNRSSVFNARRFVGQVWASLWSPAK